MLCFHTGRWRKPQSPVVLTVITTLHIPINVALHKRCLKSSQKIEPKPYLQFFQLKLLSLQSGCNKWLTVDINGPFFCHATNFVANINIYDAMQSQDAGAHAQLALLRLSMQASGSVT
jgi:hypothetical protein